MSLSLFWSLKMSLAPVAAVWGRSDGDRPGLLRSAGEKELLVFTPLLSMQKTNKKSIFYTSQLLVSTQKKCFGG